MSGQGELAAPIAGAPPPGTYATPLGAMTGKGILKAVLVAAAVATAAAVAVSTLTGGQPAASEVPPPPDTTLTSTSDSPTPLPTTPTFLDTPTPAPTFPEPTRSPTPPTSRPTRAPIVPTPLPTIEPQEEPDPIVDCEQASVIFLDRSNSIDESELMLEQAFAATLINEFFDNAKDAASISIGVSYFAEFIDEDIPLHSPQSFNKTALIEAVSKVTDTNLYTIHRRLFDKLLEDHHNRDEMVLYDPITGSGLSMILISDGVPVEDGMTNKQSRKAAVASRNLLVEELPNMRIFCMLVGDANSNTINYYGKLCHAFYYINEAESQDDTAAVTVNKARVAASKACQNERAQ